MLKPTKEATAPSNDPCGRPMKKISKKENIRWLFDTSKDPLEKNNIIDNHPEEINLIEGLLSKFNSEQEEPLFPSAYEVPILIDKYDGQEYVEGDDYIYLSN